MAANLTEADLRALAAIQLIQALAAKDDLHADAILAMWNHHELARHCAWIASHMLTGPDTPADFLKRLRAYIHEGTKR
jgi:hypothetical protein